MYGFLAPDQVVVTIAHRALDRLAISWVTHAVGNDFGEDDLGPGEYNMEDEENVLVSV